MIKTSIYGLNQPQGNDAVDIEMLNENAKKIDYVLNSKIELYISETLPKSMDRKTNTLYFKVTDTLNTNTSNNLKVSPAMGIKLV